MAKKPANAPAYKAPAEFTTRQADPETLKPYPKNPRLISQAAIDKVLASVREFGWRQPIVVDEDGVILVGHTRRLAAIKGGYKLVPVHDALGLTEAQKKAYRLADNRTGEESEWDLPVLSAEIAALRLEGFDLGPLGFDTPELRALEAQEPGKDPEAVPEPPAKPVTKAGDLWELGDHYLLCGDCTDEGCVEAVLDGAVPVLMATDPPYGVSYDPSWRNKVKKADGKLLNGHSGAYGVVENDNREDWSEAWALFAGSVAYVWQGDKQAPGMAMQLRGAGFEIRNLIIWGKTRTIIGRGDYHHQHETCWYAVRKGKPGGWQGGAKTNDALDY